MLPFNRNAVNVVGKMYYIGMIITSMWVTWIFNHKKGGV